MWSRLAQWILDHPRPLLLIIAVLTGVLGYYAAGVQTEHRSGNFSATDTPEWADFERVNELFGEGQTVLYIVLHGIDPYEPGFLERLDTFTQHVAAAEGVESVLSLTNVPYFVREEGRVVSRRLYDPALAADAVRARFESQPFLQGLLLNAEDDATVLVINIEPAFNDTSGRIHLVRQIEQEARAIAPEVALAGFPYLRTEYAHRITREAPLFTLLACLISLLFLYVTFRSVRGVLLPFLVVALGLVWTIGLIALFDERLNIVTAVLPALIVIIGMATTIHLSTQFFDQYALLGTRRAAVVRMVQTVGLATFLTCVTTAIGFLVLVLSGSELLAVFGTFAAAGILVLYVLAITLLPLAFCYLRPPSQRAASLATHDVFERLFDRLATFTERHTRAILGGTVVLAVVGLVGVTRISSDIYVFADFDPGDPLRHQLAVFEQEFGGILPMEVIIESEKEGLFRSLGNLRRLDRLEDDLDTLAHVTRTLGLPDLVKLANQAYFSGHPQAYRLPSSYELPFLQGAFGDFMGSQAGAFRNLPRFTDSTFTIARIYLGVEDVGTARMNTLADTVRARARAAFPDEGYEVVVTGNAITSTRSGESLVNNLIGSLAVALLLISLLMAALFRSVKLTLISLVPNVIPLLVVGGAMGYFGIVLKPSTALIFSLAFGIAVDDTIHFLAKYRILSREGLPFEQAVHRTLQYTGKAILFTSLILMSGFLVFTLSSFGGTKNMGALTALTLAVALVANLLTLPALLYRFAPRGKHPATEAVEP